MGIPPRARPLALLAALAAFASVSSARAQTSELEDHRARARAAPSDPQAGLVLGRALIRAGHVSEGTRELKRVATLPSARKGDVAVAVKYELARAAMHNKEMNRALSVCRQLATIPGGRAMSHACAAEAYLTHRRASEALFETERAQADGEMFFEAKLAEGLAQEMALDEGEAEQALREAVRLAPERYEGYTALGRLLVREGKRDEGVAALRKGVELDGSSPEALYELGRVLPPGAESLALLERATKERERFAPALEALSGHALAVGRLGVARGAAEGALAIEDTNVAARLVLGHVALAEGRAEEALAQGKKAVGLAPSSTKARLLLADAQARKGEFEPAVESYQKAYGLDRGDPTPLLRASDVARQAGKLTTARAFAEKATRDFPRARAAWVALGDALAAEKDAAGARSAYERALGAEGSEEPAAIKRKLEALTR